MSRTHHPIAQEGTVAKDTELSVNIVDDELVIRVGISTLCTAVRQCEVIDHAVMDADDDESAVEITDEAVFAQAIRDALKDEEEDGSTPVHRLLDAAANEAIEQGCEGIEFRDQ